MGRGQVLVLGDQLALRPVEVDRDDHREQDDRAAHDHRGRDVAVVAGQLRVEDEEPDELERPHEADGQHDRRPLEAVEVAGAAGDAHGPTVPFDTSAGLGPDGLCPAVPSGPHGRERPLYRTMATQALRVPAARGAA